MGIAYGANYGKPSLDLNFARNKSLIDTVSGQNFVTFSRPQANYLTTYVGSDGLIKYARADEPRFDHNPVTGESLGLLIEESRTNLVGYSADFLTGWSKFGISSLVPNAIIAPDGTLTGSFVAWQNNTGPLTSQLGLQSTVNGARGATNTLSCYAKIGTARYLALAITNNAGVTATGVFDLQTGTVNGSGSHPSYTVNATSISNVGSGWYRCSLTVTGGNDIHISSSTSGASGVYNRDVSGDGISGIYIWGAQLEAGSFPTSYIPTGASTVTRSADNAEITGTNFSRWYNQSEGTMFTNVKLLESAPSGNKDYGAWFGRGSNTISGIRHDYTQGSTNMLDVYDNSSNLTRYQLIGTAPTIRKAASAIQSGSFSYCLNGTLGSLGTAQGAVPTTIDRLLFGGYNNSNGQNKTISRFTYYPTRLQNFQLQQLTK